MLASIRKFSKTIFAKIFVAIIALPFILWGMGDLFRSGKQNVLVEINKDKINSKEFISYIQKINITKDEVESVGKSKLFDDLLTNYISEKIIDIERKNKGIILNDNGLKKIIVSDKKFYKDNKFSRTKYEKFLIENNYNATTYEKYIKNAELKSQLLNYYSGGIKLPKFIIDDLYKKENKTKEIEFIDLNKIYSKKIISEEEIKEFYIKNKDFFKEKFITFKYIKLLPEYLTENNEYNEEYYQKLDELENKILDGQTFDEIVSDNKKNVKRYELLNSRKTKKDGRIVKEINDSLFSKIFSIKNKNAPQFINLDNDYYIAEILDDPNITLTLNDKELRNTIEAQLKVQFKIKENISLVDKINSKKFKKKDMYNFYLENNVLLNKTKINGINDKKNFSLDLVKKIYQHNNEEIFVLTDNILQKNFLVRINKETDPIIKNESKDYKKYTDRANSLYISKIYKSYDKYINSNYKIETNQKVLERLKNSF
mgnify:FL=1|tara:strand:+ start:1005 stop:2459 length:1455 start_codon:yes stop_codon:yes gene_type:complete